MFRNHKTIALLLVLLLAPAIFAQTTRRPLKLDDLTRFRDVRDPQVSPDGQLVAYVVATVDTKDDKSSSHIWMVSMDGKNDRQVTFSQDSESSPRWSPDGKYLSLLHRDQERRAAIRCGCLIGVVVKPGNSLN